MRTKSQSENLKGKNQFANEGVNRRIILTVTLKQNSVSVLTGFSSPDVVAVACCSEQGNEPLSSREGVEFIQKSKDGKLCDKNFAPWRSLVARKYFCNTT
jgi:hypothetical protein